MIVIKNAHLKPITSKEILNGEVLIDNGKIIEIGENVTTPENAEVIDAGGRLVTPGCIDAHSHIGLCNQNMRWEGSDINETPDPITPHLRAIDGFNPLDGALKEALRGGVTTACTGPGSANVVGGTFIVTKLAGKRVDKMVITKDAAMKCAFGENPKSSHGQAKGASPKTRISTAALLRDLIFKTKEYVEKKEKGDSPAFNMKYEAMIPVVTRAIPLKAHAHRADDIFTAIRIAKEFGLKLTLDHCTDGALIADELAEEGYPVLVGPVMTNKSKPEQKNQSFEAAGVLSRAGVKICIITDAPVILEQFLPLTAGLAVSNGLDEEEAWKAITINPAEVLGVDERIGSLEVGKDADIVIWTADPLKAVGAEAYITLVDGKIVYRA